MRIVFEFVLQYWVIMLIIGIVVQGQYLCWDLRVFYCFIDCFYFDVCDMYVICILVLCLVVDDIR